MAAQTPYFWAAAGPIIIGGGVSYWIDPDEGLENYEEFIFDMDLNEKVDATIWAADTLLEEGYDRSIGVVAPTAMNILSNRSAQTLEFAATRSPMAAMRFLIANQR
jgi:hypothetical protein